MMHKNKGFTLVELVVSIVLYGIVMTAVLGSFWSLVQTRQKLDRFRSLQKDLNFAMVRIADSVRAYPVDYTQYSVTTGNSIDLGTFSALATSLHYPLHLRKGTTPIQIELRNDLNTILLGGAPILSEHSKLCIDTIPFDPLTVSCKNQFRIYPIKDPFQELDHSDQQIQPRVEINISLQDRDDPKLILHAHTTISSRVYSGGN